jgi:hypothetical protein
MALLAPVQRYGLPMPKSAFCARDTGQKRREDPGTQVGGPAGDATGKGRGRGGEAEGATLHLPWQAACVVSSPDEARRHILRHFQWRNGHADLAGMFRDATTLSILGPALGEPVSSLEVTGVVAIEAAALYSERSLRST